MKGSHHDVKWCSTCWIHWTCNQQKISLDVCVISLTSDRIIKLHEIVCMPSITCGSGERRFYEYSTIFNLVSKSKPWQRTTALVLDEEEEVETKIFLLRSFMPHDDQFIISLKNWSPALNRLRLESHIKKTVERETIAEIIFNKVMPSDASVAKKLFSFPPQRSSASWNFASGMLIIS